MLLFLYSVNPSYDHFELTTRTLKNKMENTKSQNLKDSLLSRKSYAWTLFGIILTVISGIFAIYAFVYTRQPELSFIVTSKTNVLDINAPLSNMDILLDSLSLKDRNENIKVFNLKIKNNGNANITTELYDSHMPISLHVTGGNILKSPEVIMSSNDYIGRNLQSRFKLKNDSVIVIPNIIMDIADYADIKLLILHKNDIMPKIGITGKISGQKELIVTEVEIKNAKSFWDDYFPLSIGVFFAQLFSYLVIFILFSLIFIFTFEKITDWFTAYRRKITAKEFELKYKTKAIDRFIINKYLDDGFVFLDEAKKLIDNPGLYSLYNDEFLKENEVITNENVKPNMRKLITKFHTFVATNGYLN